MVVVLVPRRGRAFYCNGGDGFAFPLGWSEWVLPRIFYSQPPRVTRS